MSGGEVRKVSRQDIQLVQNLIEYCLQLYMSQKEVVDTLSFRAKIEPSFTELVWQKLEEENREFFKAYYVRLMLKNQITVFNRLLEDQYRLMTKEHPSGVNSVSLPNGSNSSALNQIGCYLSDHPSTSTMPRNGGSFGGIVNGGSSGEQLIHAGKDIPILAGNMDASTSVLSTQSSTVRKFNGVSGTSVKTEPNYSSSPEFAFCTDNTFDNTFLEPCPSIGDPSGGSFSSSELTGQPLNDPLLEIDTSSFGFFSQIPRNFSFSDLTADFAQSADILENYTRSPFLPPEANRFSDSTGGDCKG